MPTIAVAGAFGKMGRISCHTLQAHPDFELVAELGRQDDLAHALQNLSPDVLLDFTLPECVFDHARLAISSGVRPVVGTSGLNLEQIEQLSQQCAQQGLGGMVVPNFSIGAILMMRFSAQAARYFSSVDMVELHHDKKVDAPSGTARKTAELMSPESSHAMKAKGPLEHHYHGVPIHSVRLPGLFAHQSVRLHGQAETLTIKHDAHSRQSMMAGVVLSAQRVMTLNTLEYGLESALFDE